MQHSTEPPPAHLESALQQPASPTGASAAPARPAALVQATSSSANNQQPAEAPLVEDAVNTLTGLLSAAQLQQALAVQRSTLSQLCAVRSDLVLQNQALERAANDLAAALTVHGNDLEVVRTDMDTLYAKIRQARQRVGGVQPQLPAATPGGAQQD